VRLKALFLLAELDASCLQVVKVRYPESYHRVVMERNAEWYRRFCLAFIRRRRGRYRKPRTIIKRCHVRRALLRVADGRTDGIYVGRLLEFIDGYEFEPVEPFEPAAEEDAVPF
jgi:hypothetical protein